MNETSIRQREYQDRADFAPQWPAFLRRVYLARGVKQNDALSLGLSQLLSPEQLLGMDAAVDLLVETLDTGRSILVIGDFDADGATSCALMLRALIGMGFPSVDYLVPNRFEYGYGLTPEIVEVAAEREPGLIITVDNGISSIQGVNAARDHGIRVLVTDHHLPGEQLPSADAIVNPNQADCPFPEKSLAGVGVAFYLMLALRARLRERGAFSGARPEPNLATLLDLVALGTVADVVPLEHNNRILVHEGLRRIRRGRCSPGLLALLDVAGRDHRRAVASDLGFAAGPRLNAAGRLEDISLGIECLLTDDPDAAARMAAELDSINRQRRSIEQDMGEQADASLSLMQEKLQDGLPAGLCLHDAQWHQGVIGILASRLKERFHRPVIIFADAGSDARGRPELKGSARSIPGFHIRDALALVESRHPGLLPRFGGHAMAAGLSLVAEDFPRFQALFESVVEAAIGDVVGQQRIQTDGPLASTELSLETAELLREHGPWGQGFPEPAFDGVFEPVSQRLVAGKHLKLVLSMPGEGELVDAIAFNVDTARWPDESARRLRLVYRPDRNEFRGRVSLQLIVEHLELCLD